MRDQTNMYGLIQMPLKAMEILQKVLAWTFFQTASSLGQLAVITTQAQTIICIMLLPNHHSRPQTPDKKRINSKEK
jgi:hypothetical protein